MTTENPRNLLKGCFVAQIRQGMCLHCTAGVEIMKHNLCRWNFFPLAIQMYAVGVCRTREKF